MNDKLMKEINEFNEYLKENKLKLYELNIDTDYYDELETEYFLAPEGNDVYNDYTETFEDMAYDHLHAYSHVTEEEYYELAREWGVDLDDKESIENSALSDYDISDYYYSVEEVKAENIAEFVVLWEIETLF